MAWREWIAEVKHPGISEAWLAPEANDWLVVWLRRLQPLGNQTKPAVVVFRGQVRGRILGNMFVRRAHVVWVGGALLTLADDRCNH